MNAVNTNGPAILFVANFSAGTGYAWDTIESMFAGVAERLAGTHGARTFVSYPAATDTPKTLAGSPARAIAMDTSFHSPASVRAVAQFVRQEKIRVIYLTDRPAWHPAYLALRLAGAKAIVVHSRTSGGRDVPRGLRWLVKWLLARAPGIAANTVITVSNYVARLRAKVALIPAARLVMIWNGVPLADVRPPDADILRPLLGVKADQPIVAMASRADPGKGVAELMRAFDALCTGPDAPSPAPLLVYVGDGPWLPPLRALRESLASRDSIHLLGYRPDAKELIGNADVAVLPTWQEAFGNMVVEAMARGRPVIGTRVGGVPEIIEDGVSGLLIPPGDVPALATALRRLLTDPALRAAMGAAASARVAAMFTNERQMDAVAQLLAPWLESQ